MRNIDWEAVLEDLEDELLDKMRMERQCDPDYERNPYTFQAFYLREKIGSGAQTDDLGFLRRYEQPHQGLRQCEHAQRHDQAVDGFHNQ